MSFKGIMEQLNRCIGLNGETLHQKVLTRAVKERMDQLGLVRIGQYQDLIGRNSTELDWLIDQVVVPETWFFRDVEPYHFLRAYLLNRFRQEPQMPVRILSIPCSSGEEPYSIAMTVAGMTGLGNLKVDAVDVSGAALKRARMGRFGPNAFRDPEMESYWRYFQPINGEWQISEDIIGMVQFHRGNILDYYSLNHNVPYHVIFCRNLMIYLDEKARRVAVEHIDRLLAPDGLLFLGYAESRQQLFPDYIGVRHPRAYASIKPGADSKKDALPVDRPTGKPKVEKPLKGIVTGHRQRSWTPPAAIQDREPSAEAMVKDPLAEARQLADAGLIDQAAQICMDILTQDPGQVEAHFLLGVTALAGGKDLEAESHFARALYLDPEHGDSLTYMVLLMERLGRTNKTALLRNRLARIQDRRSLGDERKTETS